MNRASLTKSYLSSAYGALGRTFALCEQGSWTPPWAEGGRRWALITAWNPRSVRLCAADNERRGARLRSDLEARGLPCHPAGNGEGEWAEPGFLVLDLSLRTAAELGERWEQNAVIWGVGRRAALVWCADGRQMTRRWLCEKGM